MNGRQVQRSSACLIEKPDEPARSRHCEGSEPARMPLGGCSLGKAQGSDEPSQENCLFDNPPCAGGTYLRATGRGFVKMIHEAFLLWQESLYYLYFLGGIRMKNWKKMLVASLACSAVLGFSYSPAEASYELNPEVKTATPALMEASEIGVLKYENPQMRNYTNKDAIVVTSFGTLAFPLWF